MQKFLKVPRSAFKNFYIICLGRLSALKNIAETDWIVEDILDKNGEESSKSCSVCCGVMSTAIYVLQGIKAKKKKKKQSPHKCKCILCTWV